MKIEHIALWTNDLDKMATFYLTYFDCTASKKYTNPGKNFSSVFLTFDGGARIELMHKPEVFLARKNEILGFTHLAISVGNRSIVDSLTARIKNDGFTVMSEPRTTGDGYYESLILDPENNQVEITE